MISESYSEYNGVFISKNSVWQMGESPWMCLFPQKKLIWFLCTRHINCIHTYDVDPKAAFPNDNKNWAGAYGSGHETVAVLLPGFAINW